MKTIKEIFGRGGFEPELLLAHVLKKPRVWLIAHTEKSVTKKQHAAFLDLMRRRSKHEPLAYLLGEAEFFGRIFSTDKRALIPRPETELMVKRAIKLLDEHPRSVVWDVGTGSGAIAVTVKKERPTATVVASDISTDALALAKRNGRHLKAWGIQFLQADLLGTDAVRSTRNARHLILLANLPYLPLSDKKRLDPQVVHHEPSQALFAGRDGLAVIRRLLRQLSDKRFTLSRATGSRYSGHAFPRNGIPLLGTRFTLLLEFDPPQSKKIRRLAEQFFPDASVTIYKDLNGHDRLCEIRG